MKLRNQKGFSFVEILVTVTIVSLLMAGGYAVLSSGESSWLTAEANIQVQENLRRAVEYMTQELRQSKYSEVTVSNNTGLNGSDVITFRVPVICKSGTNLLNAAGDVAYWGATLRWGCRDLTCMDADDDCGTVEYKAIRYLLVSGNRLARQVLDNTDSSIREDLVANNISDLQAELVNPASPMNLMLTGQAATSLNRTLTASVKSHLDFRNK